MFGNDYCSQVFHSSLDIDHQKRIEQYLYRDNKFFSRPLPNEKIPLTNWRAMYQQKDANSRFQIFSVLFQTVYNILALIKNWRANEQSKQKKSRLITKKSKFC